MPLDADGVPSSANPAADGSLVRIRRFAGTWQNPGTPSQTWNASHIQWDDGSCGRFRAQRRADAARAGFVRADALLDRGGFAVLLRAGTDIPAGDAVVLFVPRPDLPKPAVPDRRDAHGLIDDLPFGIADYPAKGTIFDLLSAHGISWANYHHLSPIQVHWRRLSRVRGLNVLRVLGALLAGFSRS